MKAAILLAAGAGSRAWPYCGIRQKVTLPILNVPMVRRLALQLRELGIDRIVAVVGHRAEAVRACLIDLPGMHFVEQRVLKGPADAALLGLESVEAPDVLVCSADCVTSTETLRVLTAEYERSGRETTLLTADVPPNLPHWIAVQTGPDGTVTGITWQNETFDGRFGGIAAAPAETLKTFLLRHPGIMENVDVGGMPPVEGDLAYTFALMLRDGRTVRAVRARDFFVDVDKPWDVLTANHQAGREAFALLDKTVLGEGASVDESAEIAEGAHVYLAPGARIGKRCILEGSAILGPGALVENGAILGPGVTIGPRTRVKDYCKVSGHAVIGADCIIGHGAEFSGTMLDGAYLYHYCCITGLLGAKVDIGAATVCGTLRFDNRVRVQDVKGCKETPAHWGCATYMGDYSRSGVNVMFMPGVKVGHYSCVGAGAIVYEDVPDRTLLLPKQEHVLKPWGPERYGW